MDIDAIDNDIGENARVSYHFGGNTNEFGPFQINSDTGLVTTVGSIDREGQSSYTVRSSAINDGTTIIALFTVGHNLCIGSWGWNPSRTGLHSGHKYK